MSADGYRVKAADFLAKAQVETNPTIQAELEALALSYLRLAEQAERNLETPYIPREAPEGEMPDETSC